MGKEIQQEKLAQELRKQNISEEKRRLILKEVREKVRKEDTMKLSIKEGSYTSVMVGLADTYMIPFALALGANNLQIGLFRSLHGLLPPISQLYGPKLMNKYSRKRIILTAVAAQALLLIPIILLSLLFMKDIFRNFLPYILIIFYTIYAIASAISIPAWFSLMRDIVPENIRGRYFGKRNKIVGIVALISTLVGAFALDWFKTGGLVLIGFSILFFIAMIARLLSAYSFKKHYNPKFRQKKREYFSFFRFLKFINKHNFNKFTLFVAVMYFSVSIAGPFFAVYMLKELQFSYITFMIIILSPAVSSLVMMPVWGKFFDKYGGKETLLLSSIFITMMPFLWLVSPSPVYLIFPMVLVGIGWAGFNLASFNFIYDSTNPQKRSLCLTYYNILLGFGIFVGSAIGGLILHYLPDLVFNASKFFVIFVISASLRVLTSLIFLPRVKEVRKVKRFHPFVSIRKMGLTHGIAHELYVAEKGVENGVKKVFKS